MDVTRQRLRFRCGRAIQCSFSSLTIVRSFPFLAVPALLVLCSCAVNPATGRRELSLVGEDSEIRMGREADQEITASLGLVEDSALQAYVSDVGRRLAAASERPTLPWSFKVVDDPVVNAFALPGGFVFVTRGILANLASEAELAGVLGHEIGHVTARHSVSQMSRQRIQQIGVGVGMVLSEDVRRFEGVLSAGLGLLNLRYSRGDETQSDELGVRYLTRTGYDPRSMEGVFEMLAEVGGGGGRVPEWQLTHPLPENREAHVRALLDEAGVAAEGRMDRDALLDHLGGLVYGEDPRQGYFDGPRFLHPELAFEVRFPVGWTTVNQRSVVAAQSPEKDAVVLLEAVPGAEDPAVALRAFLARDGVGGGAVRHDDAYGIDRARASFTLRSDEGVLQGEVVYLRHGATVYRMVAYASVDDWGPVRVLAAETLSSFAPVTSAAVLAVQPDRVEIVRLPSAMTLAAFFEAYPSAVPLDEVARLNRRSPGDVVEAGTRLKRVVGPPRP